MDVSPNDRMGLIASITFASTQCRVCLEGEISSSDPIREAEALKTASESWKNGQFPGLSEEDVARMMRAFLDGLPKDCPECALDVADDYDLGTMHMSTETLDQAATLIYNRTAKKGVQEIYEYIGQIKRAMEGSNIPRLLELAIDGVLFDYNNAYQDEVAARRAAPIWHTRERNEEKRELRIAQERNEALLRELDLFRLPETKYRDEWERHQSDYRAMRAAQDRLGLLERKAELLTRFVIFISTALLLAVFGDVCAVLWPGSLYREAGKFLIGASGIITLVGPFLLFAAVRERHVARDDLTRYGPILTRQAGIAGKTPHPE